MSAVSAILPFVTLAWNLDVGRTFQAPADRIGQKIHEYATHHLGILRLQVLVIEANQNLLGGNGLSRDILTSVPLNNFFLVWAHGRAEKPGFGRNTLPVQFAAGAEGPGPCLTRPDGIRGGRRRHA